MSLSPLNSDRFIHVAREASRIVKYSVVDTETHTFLRCWPMEPSPQMSPVEPYTRCEHSGELLVAELDRAGVDCAILIGYDGYDFAAFMTRFGSEPAAFMGGRCYTSGWAERFPYRLKYVTTLRDRRRDGHALSLLENEISAGAVGVKIFPAYLKCASDAAEIRAAFEIVRDNDRCVVFGFEDTAPPTTPSLVAMYEGIGRLARDFPTVPIQLNHGGNADPLGPEMEVLVEVVEKNSTILISTSVLGGPLNEWSDGWRYPFKGYLERLAAFVDRLPSEQVAWGTDWPWFEGVAKYPQLLQAVVDHGPFASEATKREYLGTNALRHWRLQVQPSA